MKISVQLFALAKDLAGTGQLEIELPSGATVADVRDALGQQVTALLPHLPLLSIAVDSQYANEQTRIPPDSEVAVIPPVSGG